MKYLLLLLVLGVAYALWRAGRGAGRDGSGRPGTGSSPPGSGPASTRATPAAPQDMVRCPVCSLHLPRGDAVVDSQGRLYCSAQHRDQAPR